MNTTLTDYELVQKAGFTSNIELVAQTTVISLRYLQTLAAKLKLPREQITPQYIIAELAQSDAQIREQNAALGKPQ